MHKLVCIICTKCFLPDHSSTLLCLHVDSQWSRLQSVQLYEVGSSEHCYNDRLVLDSSSHNLHIHCESQKAPTQTVMTQVSSKDENILVTIKMLPVN